VDDDPRALRRDVDATTGRDDLEESAVLALWATAWLRGEVSLDDTRDAVVGPDAAHDVLDTGAGASTPLILALGAWRGAGATGLSLALPVAGDPLGLAGPPTFNGEALQAEQAAVVQGAGIGLVPSRAGAGVVWRTLPAVAPPASVGVAAAERELRQELTTTADRLVDLDVARWRPEVADELMDLRKPLSLPVPPGLPGRSQALLALASRCRRIVALALEDDGGSVTAREADVRRAALLPLDAAARRAVVAACDPARPGTDR
jgi:hypothetical protein